MGWPVRHAGKEDKQVQKFLQKLEGVSQALLDPLSYLTAAGLLIVAAPLIAVYVFGQRYIVDGVMAGGLKG